VGHSMTTTEAPTADLPPLRRLLALGLLAALIVVAILALWPPQLERRTVVASLADGAALMAELGYTQARWRDELDRVPRLYLTDIGENWRESWAQDLPLDQKKDVFFRLLLPLVLRANELVAADRARLAALRAAGPDRWSTGDRAWLKALADLYRLDGTADPSKTLDRLRARVDVVPPSLALAQAAEETGWGTSRFAAAGNALFGQWTYDPEGMLPQDQRGELGDYRVAAFETPLASVQAYVHNLNTNPVFGEFRALRAAEHAAGRVPQGLVLAGTLALYSERGADYVTSIQQIIRVNELAPVDTARLAAGPALYLSPG